MSRRTMFLESFQHNAFDMFCEDVRLVVVRRNFLQDDFFVSVQLLDEQEAHGNVFSGALARTCTG